MGTRYADYLLRTAGKDHPHAYGDKWYTSCANNFGLGSSPRVWGQVTILVAYVVWKRIIPTRMGTSEGVHADVIVNTDHPHAYGDKTIILISLLVTTKSSPRVWGQDAKRAYEVK